MSNDLHNTAPYPAPEITPELMNQAFEDVERLEMPEAAWITSDSSEWRYAWGYFADPAERCNHCGEVWQYMGTYKEKKPGAPWFHQFRHRDRPATGKREIRNIIARAKWAPEPEEV